MEHCTSNHAYLHVTHDERLGGRAQPLAVPHGVRVGLRVRFSGPTFQFSYAFGDGPWQPFGPALPASMLSDEHATTFDGGYARSFDFTGNFIGIACQDLAGTRLHADFDHFGYREITPPPA